MQTKVSYTLHKALSEKGIVHMMFSGIPHFKVSYVDLDVYDVEAASAVLRSMGFKYKKAKKDFVGKRQRTYELPAVVAKDIPVVVEVRETMFIANRYKNNSTLAAYTPRMGDKIYGLAFYYKDWNIDGKVKSSKKVS